MHEGIFFVSTNLTNFYVGETGGFTLRKAAWASLGWLAIKSGSMAVALKGLRPVEEGRGWRLRFFDLASGALLRTYSGYASEIRCIAYMSLTGAFTAA